MGDFGSRLPKHNGGLADQSTVSTSPWQSEPSNPHPSEIPSETWRFAEWETRTIIREIQPTDVSEERRRNVVECVQKLINASLGYEVFPFGSVPLKTYLPDGDIDLTAVVPPNYEEYLAADVHTVLEREEQNKATGFEVKDVQYIHAEVKLVKCLVQNIVVDISFNQIGGLSTLFFLEQVDSFIGKHHLFKRTIILIKAWCYHESRILGAHHSLISTYALETLVLYIFHLFHSSLDGPLAVLYRFLDYFSKFDWDNFCISLRGPVHTSSLPEIIAEEPENDGGDLLLSTEFLNRCGKICSASSKFSESNHKLFVKKHLNIVDPLKENNNLGRSVSKGNLYRIRSAFSYGARKLGRILLLPRESIPNELKKFFKNTLERHGNRERPDVQDTYSGGSDSKCVLPYINRDKDIEKGVTISLPLPESFHGGHKDLIGSRILVKENGTKVEPLVTLSNYVLDGNHLQSFATAETILRNGTAVSGSLLNDDAKNVKICRMSGPRSPTDRPKHSSTSTDASTPTKAYHAPHMFFCQELGKITKKNVDQITMVGAGTNCLDLSIDCDEIESLTSNPQPFSNNRETASIISDGGLAVSNGVLESSSVCSSVGDEGILDYGSGESDLAAENKAPEVCGLANLSGNHEEHLRNLQRAQWFYDLFSCGSVPAGHLPSTFHYPTPGHMVPHINGYIPSMAFPRAPSYSIYQGGYRSEDARRTRGTGLFIPNTSLHTYRDKSSMGRGRNQPTNQMSKRNNARAVKAQDFNSTGTRGFPVLNANGRGKPGGHTQFTQSSITTSRGFSQSDSNTYPSESQLEFGSFGPVSLGVPEPGLGCNVPQSYQSGSMVSSSMIQKSGTSLSHERLTQLYRLKDEVEFPPLSGQRNQNSFMHTDGEKPAWEAKR